MTISPSMPRRSRDQSRLNLIDYALMALGASLAVYTAGMSIGREDTAQFLALGVLLGTTLSYAVRALFGNTAVVRVDGVLYAAAIGCAVVGFPTLNAFLPEEGFARDVLMAGVLSFMLVLGSAVSWRDGTLLFQAIPSVALFGLVGCYDTYAYAPYLFFGFLVCLAIVLARANRREMMRQAVESGYFNRADAPSTPREFPEQSPELYEDIRRGPWRWQAGPEWALASALVIVLLSRLGAPALQEAAKPITGAVRILAPQSVRQRMRDQNSTQPTTYNVGQGPNRSLSDHVVYIAQLDRPRYLRTGAYPVYTGRGWSDGRSPNAPRTGLVGAAYRTSIREMRGNRRTVDFAIKPTDPTRELPLPAEPTLAGQGFVRDDGGGVIQSGATGFVQGQLYEPTKQPSQALRDLEPTDREMLSVEGVRPRVREFAQRAAEGATDDADKARRIATAIAGQVKYNIEAAAVPADADPAEWFLFDNREGYCDLFATSMTLCARSVGLPARYVIGYLPEKSDGAGNYSVREADYHAWCEVFFKDVGWVVFDATSGAEAVEGNGRGSSDESRPWYQAGWIAPAARVFLGALAVVVGYFMLRGMRPKARPPRWEAHRAYVRFERALRRGLGRRRAAGESILAYALAGGEAYGDGAVRLGGGFERALYGPAEPSEDELKALREGTRALKRR